MNGPLHKPPCLWCWHQAAHEISLTSSWKSCTVWIGHRCYLVTNCCGLVNMSHFLVKLSNQLTTVSGDMVTQATFRRWRPSCVRLPSGVGDGRRTRPCPWSSKKGYIELWSLIWYIYSVTEHSLLFNWPCPIDHVQSTVNQSTDHHIRSATVFRVLSQTSLFAELAFELVIGKVVFLEQLLGGEEGGACAAAPPAARLGLVAGHPRRGRGRAWKQLGSLFYCLYFNPLKIEHI